MYMLKRCVHFNVFGCIVLVQSSSCSCLQIAKPTAVFRFYSTDIHSTIHIIPNVFKRRTYNDIHMLSVPSSKTPPTKC